MTTRAIISTDLGDIEADLFTEGAPKAAQNFVDLANKGFYDDVIFHRVIPGFMIQGGDGQFGKKATLNTGRVGTGGPGYKFDDEPFTGSYLRGTLAMANAGPNTNGSQFFIMHADYALPKNYTIFGQVTKGLDIVDQIAGRAAQLARPAGRARRDDEGHDRRGVGPPAPGLVRHHPGPASRYRLSSPGQRARLTAPEPRDSGLRATLASRRFESHETRAKRGARHETADGPDDARPSIVTRGTLRVFHPTTG